MFNQNDAEIIEVEDPSKEIRFTFTPGDIVRMKRANAYCKPGKFAVLSLDTTVCLARTKKKSKQRRITRRLVYIQITDLCFFKRTRKRIEPPSLNSQQPNCRVKADEGNAVKAIGVAS